MLVTEWDQFRSLDLPRLRQAMKTPVVVDLRNVFDEDEMTRHGFSLVPLGKRPRSAYPARTLLHAVPPELAWNPLLWNDEAPQGSSPDRLGPGLERDSRLSPPLTLPAVHRCAAGETRAARRKTHGHG